MLSPISPAMPAPETSAGNMPPYLPSSARSAPSPGSSLGKLVDGNRLLFLFGLVMVAVGAMMLRPRRENAAVERKANLATYLQTAAVAFLAGWRRDFSASGADS